MSKVLKDPTMRSIGFIDAIWMSFIGYMCSILWRIIKMYLLSKSFLNTEMAKVIQINIQERQELVFFT